MCYSNEPIYDELRTIACEIEKELKQGEMGMYAGGRQLYTKMSHYASGIVLSEIYAVIKGLGYCEIALDWYIEDLVY